MPVHRLERREQPRPSLAVQAADRSAQPVDRLGQFRSFRQRCRSFRLQRGEFRLGDEVDRSDSLTLRRQPLEPS
jgi:hypothetical protein